MFQDQFLGVIEADPNALFELPIIQENEGDQQALMFEMEQQTIPLPNEEIEETRWSTYQSQWSRWKDTMAYSKS